MKEIEQIIMEFKTSYGNTEQTLRSDIGVEHCKDLATALNQYIIRQRIEELENCGSHWEKIRKRIAELKKGLK